jgi:hypothetical protein
MLLGVGVYVALLAVGVNQTQQTLIEGYFVVLGGIENGTCMTEVFAGGLRGVLIAWGDSLFIKYNSTMYNGPIGTPIEDLTL